MSLGSQSKFSFQACLIVFHSIKIFGKNQGIDPVANPNSRQLVGVGLLVNHARPRECSTSIASGLYLLDMNRLVVSRFAVGKAKSRDSALQSTFKRSARFSQFQPTLLL